MDDPNFCFIDEEVEDKDHPADVQIHSWGRSIGDAFEMAGIGVCGYMTDIENVDCKLRHKINAKGHDYESLLFDFLCKIEMTLNEDNFEINAICFGENYNQKKHIQGTEVKAITYSNMQIYKGEKSCHIYTIIDI